MGTIAQKLEYLNGTKQALKESINNLGGDITSETTFREYAQELDNIYDNLPKTTGEDTNLSLTTIKGKMNIQVKGDTQQNGTPTPDTPIDIEVVTGTQTITISNSDNTETQTQTISLGDIELCKIGNYQDYLYKSNDKWYKKEYIGKYTFTGNETIDQFSSRTNTIRFSIANVLPTTLVAQEYNYNAYCNYLKAQDIYNNDVQGFFTHFNGSSATRIYIGLDKTIASTSEQAKTWLGNVKPILYYQLRTPNDIEITNETLVQQLENLTKLYSYNGTTNITSTSDTGCDIILSVSALKGA